MSYFYGVMKHDEVIGEDDDDVSEEELDQNAVVEEELDQNSDADEALVHYYYC